MRRYAANNVDINSIWKVITPDSVPCATILSLLERMVGSSRYTTAQRKIFFDAVYRRLLTLSGRSDVLYARGIVRIFVKLNFFLEDSYFHKLSALLDYLAAKERVHHIHDGLLDGYIARMRTEKEKAGHVATEEPTFDGIPLVVLRRLARDGHFWKTLIAHPIAKIARETVPHVSTRDRAMLVATNHRINPEVLRGLGRKRDLFYDPQRAHGAARQPADAGRGVDGLFRRPQRIGRRSAPAPLDRAPRIAHAASQQVPVREALISPCQRRAHAASVGRLSSCITNSARLLSAWWTIPFAGMLLSIALFPLFAPRFWHHRYPEVSIVLVARARGSLSLRVPRPRPGTICSK